MSEESQHRRDWEALAELDPLYAILSTAEAKHGGWDTDAFLATGIDDVARILTVADTLGLPAARRASFELGCGVGRLTRALASHFDRSVGVDISTTMIAQARDLNADVANCEWIVNTDDDLRQFDDGSFDLVLSHLVLQHVPTRALIVALLGELARILAPGGLLIAQLPASMPLRQRLQPRRRAYAVLRRVGVSDAVLYRKLGLHPIRMNWVPRPRVEACLCAAGARVLDIELGWLGDRATTGREINLTYLATRDERRS
jgi:SAM-dependent methyltransferase